ncbi:MAG: hypothetical protein N2043_02255 [Ignavibacterium sp.]|nr:hypothetical protein [Ignavibacterium sp.]
MAIKFIYDNRNSFSESGQVKPVRMLLHEIHETITGQTIIQLKGKYKVGNNELEVLVNGVPQRCGVDYYEINEKTIQFVEPFEFGEIVQCIVRGAYVVTHRTQYTLQETTQVLLLDTPYQVGADTLLVFLNGKLLQKDVDYFEEDEYTIRFSVPHPEGTQIVLHEVR